jgi:hypothetical protein
LAEFEAGTWTGRSYLSDAERRPELSEPGLDLDEWETRWADLQDQAADAPDEAREIARAAETTPLEPDDLDAALEDLQEIHDFMIEGRAPP